MIPSDGAMIAQEAHRRWSAACPKCAKRRVLWPVGQNVNSGYEPHAKWVHMNGLDACS